MPKPYVPQLYDRAMPIEMQKLAYYGYCEFKHKGRPLCVDDVWGILEIKYRRPNMHRCPPLILQLDHPEWPFTQDLKEKISQETSEEFGKLWNDYLEKDEVASMIAANLEGLTVRLPDIAFSRHRPVWDDNYVHVAIIAFSYALLRWCKEEDGKDIKNVDCKSIIEYHLFRQDKAHIRLFNILLNAEHITTKAIAPHVVQYQRFYGNIVHGWHIGWCTGLQRGAPKLVLPEDEGGIGMLSSAMEGHALTAPAPIMKPYALIAPAPARPTGYGQPAPGPSSSLSATAPASAQSTGLRSSAPNYFDKILNTPPGEKQNEQQGGQERTNRAVPRYNDKIINFPSPSSANSGEKDQALEKIKETETEKREGKQRRSRSPANPPETGSNVRRRTPPDEQGGKKGGNFMRRR